MLVSFEKPFQKSCPLPWDTPLPAERKASTLGLQACALVISVPLAPGWGVAYSRLSGSNYQVGPNLHQLDLMLLWSEAQDGRSQPRRPGM